MRRGVRQGAAFLGVATLGLLAGCGTFFVYPGSDGGSGNSSTNYVYVANATTQSLAGYKIGTATLTAVTNSPYSLGLTPTAVAVTPKNTFLYVGSNSAIYGFSIGSGGALTSLNGGAALALASIASMDISPDGQWLFVLDQNGLTLEEYQINTGTGVLTQEPLIAYAINGVTVVPHAIKFAPSGAYIFVALGTGGELVYPFTTSNGSVAAPLTLAPVTTTTSDNALAVSPSTSYLYIARSGTQPGIWVYSIGSGGALNKVSGSPFPTGTQSAPSSMVINSAGTYLYVTNRGDNTISEFSIGSGGVLTALSPATVSSGTAVTALALDSTGSYLLAAANGGSPDLSLYTFDSTTAGKLNLATSTATGTDPTGPVALAASH